MKKIFGMLLILVFIYLGIQLGFRFFGNGHEYEYQVVTNDINFNVKEKFTNNTKNELDSYNFEISNGGYVFYYQTLSNFNKKDHIIKNIYSYKNDKYNCILPVFENNKMLTDIMCLKDNKIYYYHDLMSEKSLEPFATSLKDIGYDVEQWVDKTEPKNQNNITIYSNNIIDNHSIGLTNYKGVYIINPSVGKEIEDIELFQSDIYKRPLSLFFEKYYITANYNEQYRFTKISVVDLTNNKTKEINCETQLSFDSYIQGSHDNSIYIFDRSTKKQYEINLKTSKVLEIGNENSGIIIYNGTQKERINAGEATKKDILFTNVDASRVEFKSYEKVDLVGGKETGYYYLYQKKDKYYEVYRANVLNPSQLTYIFTTTDLDRIVYQKNYIYFIYNDVIKYYSDNTGIKSVVKERELGFNKALIFGVYES